MMNTNTLLKSILGNLETFVTNGTLAKYSELYDTIWYMSEYVFDEDNDYLCFLEDMESCCLSLANIAKMNLYKYNIKRSDIDYLFHACANQMIKYSNEHDYDDMAYSYLEYYPFNE